ncbi:MAG: osmolarity sensor protein OmpB [Pseudomonadota bacterium]|uniref:histidine kinase n=1 Tax=Pseudaquabacterium rugosum TaxID=2984194 RepID=A0ABU9B516_9BURK
MNRAALSVKRRPAPLDIEPAARAASRKQVGLSLFWRTFFLLLLLMSIVLSAWMWALHRVDGNDERAADTACALAGTVHLLRGSVARMDPASRPAWLLGLRGEARPGHDTGQGMRLQPRLANDQWQALPDSRWARELEQMLRRELGDGPAQLQLAAQVNGQAGLWLGLLVEGEPWWLSTGIAVPAVSWRNGWALDQLPWLGVVAALTLLGSALVAHRINRPLRDLSFAASRIRGGEYDSRLDETHVTSEIREVNMGFNRMARELAKVEEDRAVMLAGISHDLRTPLARLRLEAEMSVTDDEALYNMASDIDQLDAIIDKFMDYARPGETHLKPVLLGRLVDKEASSFRDPSEIQISSRVAIDVKVYADEVELGRVLQNLFENARRYGRHPETGIAQVSVSYVRTGSWVICTVRDTGSGVPEEKLRKLTTPFFRGDTARTAATGAGLGLAIVEKSMVRMGGQVEFVNAPDGGLMVHLRLKYAK